MKIKAVTDEYIEFTNGIRYSGDCVFRTICEERFG